MQHVKLAWLPAPGRWPAAGLLATLAYFIGAGVVLARRRHRC
jgi:hypothetical protein